MLRDTSRSISSQQTADHFRRLRAVTNRHSLHTCSRRRQQRRRKNLPSRVTPYHYVIRHLLHLLDDKFISGILIEYV